MPAPRTIIIHVSDAPADLARATDNARLVAEQYPDARVRVIINGAALEGLRTQDGIDVPPGQSSITFSHTATVSSSAWYSLRAVGKAGTFPVENTRPLAVTNPVYVTVGGGAIRVRESAEYFVKWIDVLTGMAEKHPGWRSDKEKAHVLGQFKEARDIYVARAAEAKGQN